MVRAGFLNDNEYRQYPFTPNKLNTLSDDLIADCGFIMGIDSEFDPAAHSVYLAKISRSDFTLSLEFRTTAPAAVDYPIVFTRLAGGDEWETEYVVSAVGEPQCATEPMWEGFLVSGVIDTVFDQINDGGEMTLTSQIAVVEPGRIQTLAKSYLRSINLGNYARVSVPPQSCDPGTYIIPADVNYVITNATCLRGDVKFEPGHHCVITQQNFNNTLVISAALDGNTVDPLASELCENGGEIKLYPQEQKPYLVDGKTERSKFFSGGLACDQTITSINGLGAPDVKIVGGAGIKILPDPDNQHTLKLQIIDNIITKNC